MDGEINTRRSVAICGLLIVLTAAAFWPVLNNEFIHYDDPQYVTSNLHVSTGLTLENVGWAFSTGYASNWHPLTWISHMLDAQLFGLNPRGHHLTNLLLHTANVVLLFWVLMRMTGAQWRSALVAAFFAVHPLHVQSVAWIAERKDVLSTFFLLLTLWAYLRYVKTRTIELSTINHQLSTIHHPSSRFYAVALLFFAAGLMSKPMLVTVPFLLLVLDFWPLNRFGSQGLQATPGRLLLEKIPFLLLASAVSAITFMVQSKGHAVAASVPWTLRLANALVCYWKYLGKMVWPSHLAAFYPFPRDGLPWFQFASAGAMLVLVTLCAFVFARRIPWFTTGWLWYVGTLVPVIGFIQVGSQAMADRYTYIPLIGAFVCVVWGAAEFFARRNLPPAVPVSLALVAVGFCFALTGQQVKIWRDTLTLFEHALKVTSKNGVAHRLVAVELNDRGEKDLAYYHFRRAMEYDPNFPDVYDAVGYAAFVNGRQEEAVEFYRKALALDPTDPAFHDHIGASLWRLGRRQEAVEHYLEALRLDPDRLTAQFALGMACADAGDYSGAAARFAEAVRLKPDYAEARLRLAEALLKQGKLDQAEKQFDTLVRLFPTNIEARINLGGMLWRRGQRDKAAQQYAEVLRLDPSQSMARYNLGLALSDQGDLDGAAQHFREALRSKPDYVEALTGLARVLTREGKFKEAEESFAQAVRVCPTNANLQINLGSALLAIGETNRADAVFAEALRLDPQLPDKFIRGGATLAAQGKTKAAIANYEQALKLCQLAGTNNAGLLTALDSAYAEAGQFTEAIATAEKARDLALAAGDKSAADAASGRIGSYAKKQPYRPGDGPH